MAGIDVKSVGRGHRSVVPMPDGIGVARCDRLHQRVKVIGLESGQLLGVLRADHGQIAEQTSGPPKVESAKVPVPALDREPQRSEGSAHRCHHLARAWKEVGDLLQAQLGVLAADPDRPFVLDAKMLSAGDRVASLASWPRAFFCGDLWPAAPEMPC